MVWIDHLQHISSLATVHYHLLFKIQPLQISLYQVFLTSLNTFPHPLPTRISGYFFIQLLSTISSFALRVLASFFCVFYCTLHSFFLILSYPVFHSIIHYSMFLFFSIFRKQINIISLSVGHVISSLLSHLNTCYIVSYIR